MDCCFKGIGLERISKYNVKKSSDHIGNIINFDGSLIISSDDLVADDENMTPHYGRVYSAVEIGSIPQEARDISYFHGYDTCVALKSGKGNDAIHCRLVKMWSSYT